ncbi:MAG: MFS transporter permease, partial [Desulfobacterales bacterium]
MKEVIIPKEKAVFWMNGDGVWHNEHGPFEHPKIIRHFHNSIHKDENGYYLCQEREDVREKVYFPYEDTAIFVFQVIPGNPLQLY